MSLRAIKRTATDYFKEEQKFVTCSKCGNCKEDRLSLHSNHSNIAGRIILIEWFCLYCGTVTEARPKIVQYRQDFDTSPVKSKSVNFGSCDNCGAKLNSIWPGGRDMNKRRVCCPDCIFHPLGCRCKHGEFGQPETRFY